ncbi:MAG: efflux RND transporter periplasmic adaptor subunit, partial [Acidobacteria bacterium]|nr:efflux RND transporter periplasmic adaptor subunit [Acidobacteriota bacterium]
MPARNKFGIAMIVLVASAVVYFFATANFSSDLVLIGTVDANQVIVSARVPGRIEKLAVEEGTELRAGDLIAQLETQDLVAQRDAAAATVASLRSRVAETRSTEEMTQGETSSGVAAARARLESAKSQLAEARADLERIRLDNERIVALAAEGVASAQDRDRSVQVLKAAQARVSALEDMTRSAEADLKAAVARTHQAHAAASTVAATRSQVEQAEAQRAEAETRLGYARITAPLSGTVSVRVAREGEVVSAGSPIVTVVDLNDTWVRVGIPETHATGIGIGDSLNVRLPSGELLDG